MWFSRRVMYKSWRGCWNNVVKDPVNEIKEQVGDFPVGTVVKNPPANAGDTSLSPGPGKFHMQRNN